MARFLAVILAVLFTVGVARAEGEGRHPGSREEGERVLAVVAAVGSFRLTEVARDGYTLALADGAGHTVGALRLGLGESDRVPRFRSRSFSMEISTFAPAPEIVDTLVRAAQAVAASDGGGRSEPARTGSAPLDEQLDVTVVALFAAALLGLWRRGRVSWEVRVPHLLPAVIQILVFAYWSIYWPGVRGQVPSLALQLVMAIAADAAFSFARFGSWRIGVSPLPIVLSINLFAWFDERGVVISILTAVASKALLRRGPGHVLNPSAIGLSVAGLIGTLAPGVIHFGGLFHTMNLAPNMAELIVLLALVPQMRFRLLPVSIAAVVALRLADNPAVLRPPMILAVALLATDPATIPKTDAGKVLFGLLLGFGMPLTSVILRRLGYVDDFSKVIPIPIANALVPQLDALGAAAVARATRGVRWVATRRWGPVPNLALVGCWLVITVAPLRAEKPRSFEPALHWDWGTPLVVRDADDVPRCASNPAFCKPFAFAAELALWRDRAGAP